MILNKSLRLARDKILIALIISGYIGVSISYSNLYLFHVLLSILAIFFFYSFKENGYKLKIEFLHKPFVPSVIALFAWYVVSLFWAPSFELGFKYIFYIFCGIMLLLCTITFSSNLKKLDKIFHFLSIFVIIEIIIALLESFTSFRMPISSYSSLATFFGKEPINFSAMDNVMLHSNFTPPTGFRWNTNDLAISMVIMLPFFLCDKRSIVKIFGILAISTVIIMTASRAVFLSLIVVFSLYLVFIKKKIGTLSLIWLVAIFFIWGMSQFRESENPRINELANSVEALALYIGGEIDVGGSLEWRRELIDNGLTAFYNTGGFGLGAGGSIANQEAIGPVDGRFTSMHNFWVELLVEGGVIIAIIMIFLLFGMIYKLFIISRNSTNVRIKFYSQCLFLSISAFIPAAVAASSTIYFLPMWIMFGFAISIISVSKKEQKLISFADN